MLVAITTMVIVAYLFRNLISVEVLLVPPNYSVSNSTARGWIVNPFNGSLSIGMGFGAVIPAFLVRCSQAFRVGGCVLYRELPLIQPPFGASLIRGVASFQLYT